MERSLWWLSFADPSLPEGTQFKGVIIVRALNFLEAVKKTHILGINPGGEVRGVPLPEEYLPLIEDDWIGRLLSKAECESINQAFQKGIESRTETCPHGNQVGTCTACDIQGDLAYDAAREDRYR